MTKRVPHKAPYVTSSSLQNGERDTSNEFESALVGDEVHDDRQRQIMLEGGDLVGVQRIDSNEQCFQSTVRVLKGEDRQKYLYETIRK